MKNTLPSLVNLVTLLVGIAIGIMLAPRLERPADARSGAQVPPSTGPGAPGPPTISGKVIQSELIAPTYTTGSVGASLVLAHHMQSDELVVNGLDLLKLQQGELNLLSQVPGVNPKQIQSLVDDATERRVYQVITAPTALSGQTVK